MNYQEMTKPELINVIDGHEKLLLELDNDTNAMERRWKSVRKEFKDLTKKNFSMKKYHNIDMKRITDRNKFLYKENNKLIAASFIIAVLSVLLICLTVF